MGTGAPRILVLFGNVALHGQERGNIEAMDALRSSGCEVLFLIRGEWTKGIQAELDRRGLDWVVVPYFAAIRKGVRLRTWVANLHGILGGSWRLLWLIRSFRATHIHAGGISNILNFFPALALTRTHLVFRAGDVPIAHHALWHWAWRFLIQRASLFVANSRFLESVIKETGVPADKVSVIYNRPPERDVTAPSVAARLDSSGTTFVYVGQLIPDKGVGELIEAALAHCKRFSHACFVLVGDYAWNNPFARGLMDKVVRHSLSDRIRFTGYLSNVDGIFAAADVHVCPSLCDEGLPNVVLEAKRAGVASVVFPSGGLPELIEDGVDGHVCGDKTAAALAAAFSMYEKDPSLSRRQGEAAERSLERFGAGRFAQMWRSVYDRVQRDG